MKYIKLILIMILVLPLTGCYNYRELNDLGITGAIGITKENDEYKLFIEVLKTEKTSEKAQMPKFVLFESRGKTIQEAVRNSILESAKRLYANHLYILVIDEELAYEGINDIMDLFFRDPESRKQFYVLISKSDMYELLDTESLLETVNSKSIVDRLEANDKYLNNIVPLTFSKLLSIYVNPNKEMVMPSIKLVDTKEEREDLPKKKIVIDDTAIFKNDKLIGYINNDEALYYNIILNDVKDSVLDTLYKDSYMTIEINSSNTKIDINNRKIKINIDIIGNIAEINSDVDLTNPDTINDIEKTYEKHISDNSHKLINKIIDDYNSDIFGFVDLIYKKDYKNYNSNINLKDLEFDIKVDVTLKYKGNGAYELNEN